MGIGRSGVTKPKIKRVNVVSEKKEEEYVGCEKEVRGEGAVERERERRGKKEFF